jgi:F0F1-type ATP synthase membrane subunit b/b'
MNTLFWLLIWFIISVSVGVILGIFIKKSDVISREIHDGKYELENSERTILDVKANTMAAESPANLRAKAEEKVERGLIVPQRSVSSRR